MIATAEIRHPQPNEHGVYSRDEAERLTFGKPGKLPRAEIALMLVDGEWLSAVDYDTANGGGCQPLSKTHSVHASRADALAAAAAALQRRSRDEALVAWAQDLIDQPGLFA